MEQTDLLYRAFRGLEKEIAGNRSVTSFEANVARAPQPDKIVVSHNICHVEEDWVAAIERGLIFIGRAIEEDRQFIRSNGEVQPIEKVRHISRESVQHLSRHSDFISRRQEGTDLIPDKLYTVERLNDYTVYENRFLYVLLCRIRDFVAVRQEAILRAYKLYRGELTSKKRVVTGTRRLVYELNFVDEQDDVFSAAADPECAGYLERIEKIQQSVAFYLRTPLMVEVSRVDKIKSKITKTNVLRMDKNFREAVTLYEFLLAYDRDGYTIEREVKDLDPVGEEIAKELAVPALLSSFLVYEHGLGVENYLQEEFEREEERREEARRLALAEKIKELKKRVEETGSGMEEYMLLLEERNALLEQDSALLAAARAEIDALKGTVDSLKTEIGVLQREIDGLNEANAKLKEDMARAEEEHRRKIEEMERERKEAEEALRREHREALERAEEAHREALARAEERRKEDLGRAEQRRKEEVARAEEKARGEIAAARAECDARIAESRTLLEAGEAERKNTEETLGSVRAELKSVERERDVLSARLTALRREYGLLTEADDFTTEEGFNALEHEFETLGKLVREKWTDVKKILKREFSEGLRSVVRGKKGTPRKTAEYEALCEEVLGRREGGQAQPVSEEGNKEQQAADGQKVTGGQEEGADGQEKKEDR